MTAASTTSTEQRGSSRGDGLGRTRYNANDNGTYHLAELDGTRMAIPVAGKRIKAFKKRHDDEPDPISLDGSNDRSGAEEEPMGEE